MSETGDRQKVAVVLSGGGGNGAYEVGVLKALLGGRSPTTGYRSLEPDVVVGTSIGSFNGSFLVSQGGRGGSEAVTRLEELWLERLAGGWHDNGVFRVRGNPLDVLRPAYFFADPMRRFRDLLEDGAVLTRDAVRRGVHLVSSWDESLEQRLVELVDLSGLISTEPMRETLGELDYRAIRRSATRLEIAATNWATGELKVFANRDLSDSFGPLAIRASSSIPGFFPPVEIGAQPYCDGSVLLNTPLAPAIHAGADVLHVVYLDPDVKSIPLAHVRNTYDTLIRMMQITWALSYNEDIAAARRINRGIAAVRRILGGETVSGEEATVLQAVPELEKYVDKYRALTIYRYHPRDPLAGELGLLNFRRERIEALIDRGYQDAIEHDFEASGDIFPGGKVPHRLEPR
jgi:NTE family protein